MGEGRCDLDVGQGKDDVISERRLPDPCLVNGSYGKRQDIRVEETDAGVAGKKLVGPPPERTPILRPK